MVGFLSSFKAFMLGGLLTTYTILGGAVFYYSNKAKAIEDQLKLVSERNRELIQKLKEASYECERAVNQVQESCSERLWIERKEFQKQLRACQKLLERRNKLEEKLRDIDRL